jgi:hypothetical protein
MKPLLPLILILFFLGCDESRPRSHNYLSKDSNHQALIYPKQEISQDSQDETSQEKPIFQNEHIINASKIQKQEPASHSILSLWWILAIVISLGIIVYYIKLLSKKQKLMLDTLQETFQDS